MLTLCNYTVITLLLLCKRTVLQGVSREITVGRIHPVISLSQKTLPVPCKLLAALSVGKVMQTHNDNLVLHPQYMTNATRVSHVQVPTTAVQNCPLFSRINVSNPRMSMLLSQLVNQRQSNSYLRPIYQLGQDILSSGISVWTVWIQNPFNYNKAQVILNFAVNLSETWPSQENKYKI